MSETRAVVFGGYPDFVHLHHQYNKEEPDDVEDESEEEEQEAEKDSKDLKHGSSGPTVLNKSARLARTERARRGVEESLLQLRFQYQVLLHLVKEHFRPDKVAAKSDIGPRLLAGTKHICTCTARELQRMLRQQGGWQGLSTPVLFEAPAELMGQPFTSRQHIMDPSFMRRFPTATVLGDGLAAQFGPDWLAEQQTFEDCMHEHCFSQVHGHAARNGPLHDLWQALPDWMQCPMVVMSTGPGGSGVAFHKHSSAWLVVVEGVKHWWLYPPAGPDVERAYSALALCPAGQIAQAVANLPPDKRPIEVTQRAGQGFFVPALWWHATYNVGPTLAVGSQHHVFELDFRKAVELHPDSAFVLYHYGCEIHKSNPVEARQYFEAAMRREPLNFYYAMNQLRFYLNLVQPPRDTLGIIARLLRLVQEKLDERQRMLVLRFVVPSLFDFVEWNLGHDRLLKYSRRGCHMCLEAVLALTRPYLPGGKQARLTSALPHLQQLRYASTCAQCQRDMQKGRPGDQHTIWAHKFYCLECLEIKNRRNCGICGQVSTYGQMGHAGTPQAQVWYCEPCWKHRHAQKPVVAVEETSSSQDDATGTWLAAD